MEHAKVQIYFAYMQEMLQKVRQTTRGEGREDVVRVWRRKGVPK